MEHRNALWYVVVTEAKRKKGRSPSYPGIDIQVAIQRARELYDAEQHHPANAATIANHWGYKHNTGIANITMAALKKFGLLESEGVGKFRKTRLSDTALRIIKDKREPSPERWQLIRGAALSPKIHSQLIEEYGETLPSDGNLFYHLEMEKGFTESGAKEFVSQFKRTLSFISSGRVDTMESQDGDKNSNDSQPEELGSFTSFLATGRGMRNVKSVEIPIQVDPWPTLTAKFPLSQSAWEQMMMMLEAMKPAMVEGGNPEKPEEDESAEQD